MSAADARPTAPGYLPMGMALPSTGDIRTLPSSIRQCQPLAGWRWSVREAASAAPSWQRPSLRQLVPGAPVFGSPGLEGVGFRRRRGRAGRRGRRGWRRRCRGRGWASWRRRQAAPGLLRAASRSGRPSGIESSRRAPAVADSLNFRPLILPPPEPQLRLSCSHSLRTGSHATSRWPADRAWRDSDTERVTQDRWRRTDKSSLLNR